MSAGRTGVPCCCSFNLCSGRASTRLPIVTVRVPRVPHNRITAASIGFSTLHEQTEIWTRQKPTLCASSESAKQPSTAQEGRPCSWRPCARERGEHTSRQGHWFQHIWSSTTLKELSNSTQTGRKQDAPPATHCTPHGAPHLASGRAPVGRRLQDTCVWP